MKTYSVVGVGVIVIGLMALALPAQECPADSIWSEVKGDTAIVHHDNAEFNCCPEMAYEIVQHADTIDIFEKELEAPCDCNCCFDFIHVLVDLEPGTYLARVWGAYGCDPDPCGVTQFTISEKLGLFTSKTLMSDCGGWSDVQEGHETAAKGSLTLNSGSSNPAQKSILILYNLPAPAQVRVSIYDAAGTLTRTLAPGNQSAGEHKIYWDSRDDSGKPVPRGIYFVRLLAGTEARTLPVIVVR